LSFQLDDLPATAGRMKTQLVLGDQAVVSAANFLMGLLLARYLGPAGYGQFVLSYNVLLFVAGIQGAIIVSPMMVIGAALPAARSKEYFSAILVEQLLFSAAFVVALVFALSIASQLAPQWGLAILLWPLVFAGAGFLCQDFSRRYLFVQNRARSALINDLATHGLRCALLVGLGLALSLTTRNAFWVIGSTCVAGVLASAILSPKRGSVVFPSRESLISVAREHWSFGKWLLAEIMLYWCGSQLVIYVAAHMISVSAVGAISAGQNIIGAANILFLAMENLVPSRAAFMYAQRGEEGLKRYIRRVTMLGGAGTLVIVAVGAIWAEFWLALFYGSAYRGDGWIVAWWGAFYLLGFMQRPFSVGLRVLGRTKGIFLGTAAAAVVAVAMSYPLIRLAGVKGTMLALCMVQVAALLVIGVSFRKTLRSRQELSS
jgi:O-antigen/teichoic acid export membrane protein